MRCQWVSGLMLLSALYGSNEDSGCGKGPKPTHIDLRHIEPNGIGYNQGYSTLGVFFMPFEPKLNVWNPFLDVRAHVFNNEKPAYNVGIGMRCLSSYVWGFSAYWDYRKTQHHHSYNQVMLGLEALGEILDFRMNGYISVGTARSHFFDTKLEEVKGQQQILLHKREFSMQGANAEMGIHFDWFENMPLYFAAGPYYLIGGKISTWGGQARAALEFFEYVKIEGNTSYDHLFKWIGQGQISFIIPCGKKRRIKPRQNQSCFQAQILQKRMVQRIDRNEIIPIHTKHKKTISSQST